MEGEKQKKLKVNKAQDVTKEKLLKKHTARRKALRTMAMLTRE